MCFLLGHCKVFFYRSFFDVSVWSIASRRLTRLKSWDRMCNINARQKHDLFPNFRIGTEHLILFGRQVFTNVFLVFQAYGTFKLFVCFSTSLAVRRRTPLEIRQKHCQISLYMHWFRIVSSVNSWVARLLRLPPMFRFVRLGVQRENHCDCASSSHG